MEDDLLILNDGVMTTVDESDGLQNLTQTPTPATDADDNDAPLSTTVNSTTLQAILDADSNLSGLTLIDVALSGYNGANNGEDLFSVIEVGSVTSLSLSLGTGVTSPADSGFTSGGDPVYLYLSGDTVYGRISTDGGTTAGAIVFAIKLITTIDTDGNITGGKTATYQFAPLDNINGLNSGNDDTLTLDLTNKLFVAAESDLTFEAVGVPSGQQLFIMLGSNETNADGDPAVGIIVTGRAPANEATLSDLNAVNISTGDTVNTSKADTTTGDTVVKTAFGADNQLINRGEGMWISFVNDPDPLYSVPDPVQGSTGEEEKIQYGSVFETDEIQFVVTQLQGGGTSAQIKLTAINSTNFDDQASNDTEALDYVDDLIADNADLAGAKTQVVEIDEVTITGEIPGQGNNPGTPFEVTFTRGPGDSTLTSGSNPRGITAEFLADGEVRLTNIVDGDTVNFTTVADVNRALIENDAPIPAVNGAKDDADFDIGGFKIFGSELENVEIGSRHKFDDDGPTITASGTPTALVTDDDDLGITGADSADYSGLFSSDAGADGGAPDPLDYTLVVTATTDSGLDDVATGDDILLRNKAGTDNIVEGYLSGDDTVIAFTIEVDVNGVVTQTQLRAVNHDNDADPVETGADAEMMTGTDKVKLLATITDNDGDSASDDIDITAAFKFEDSGPSITANGTIPMLEVDESDYTTDASDDFSDIFSADSGADGFAGGSEDAATTYALSITNATTTLVDSLTGQTVTLSDDGGDVVGTVPDGMGGEHEVFRIILDESTGVIELDQSRALIHGDAGDPNDLVTLDTGTVALIATVEDGDAPDGDTASDDVDISGAFKFRDDFPTAESTAEIVLEEDDLDNANSVGLNEDGSNWADGDGNVRPVRGLPADKLNPINLVTALSVDPGEDAPAIFSFKAEGIADLNGEGLKSNGEPVVWDLAVGGTTEAPVYTLTAYVDDTGGGTAGDLDASDREVMTIVLTSAGLLTIILKDDLDHDTIAGVDASENTLSFVLDSVLCVTDNEGDPVNDLPSLTIAVQDDIGSIVVDNIVGTGTDLPQMGLWEGIDGADEESTFDLTLDTYTVEGEGTFTGPALTDEGMDGTTRVFSGEIDLDGDATTTDDSVGFTVRFMTDGTYTFDLDAEFGSTVELSTADGTLKAGGPTQVRTLQITTDLVEDGVEDILFFGVDPEAAISKLLAAIGVGEPDPDDAAVVAQHNAMAFLSDKEMNVSTSGIGLGNNNVDGFLGVAVEDNTDAAGKNPPPPDEAFIVNPESLVGAMTVYIADNEVSGYAPDATGKKEEALYYRIFYEDGTYSDRILVESGDLMETDPAILDGGSDPRASTVNFLIEPEPEKAGLLIDAVEISMGKGVVKIPVIELSLTVDNVLPDLEFNFVAEWTDNDTDTVSDSFKVSIETDDMPSAEPDFVLIGTNGTAETFNADVSDGMDSKNDSWRIEMFEDGTDTIYLIDPYGDVAIGSDTDGNATITVSDADPMTGDKVITVVGVNPLDLEADGNLIS